MPASTAEAAPAGRAGPAADPPEKPRAARFTSLRLELVILTMILVLAMSLTMGLAVTRIYSRFLGDSQLEAASAFARGAALSLSLSEDWEAFPWPTLESAADEAGLKLVLAADTRGRRALRRGSPAALDRDETTLRATLASGRPQASFDGRRYSVAAPILRQGLLTGAVCFSGSPRGLLAAEAAARNWMLAALGLNIALMAFFLVFFLNRNLMAPVKELARDLEDLGRDRFQPRLRPRAPREMEELFKAFDQAALELMDSRRRLEEQLRTISETRDHLVASEKMATVGRLASGLAHELGNPIGALTGFVHLLRQDDLAPADKTLILNHSAHELSRMDGSLKELLHFSRPGHRTPEPVAAEEVAHTAASLARPQKWASGVEITVAAESGTRTVLAERNGLLQVLLNLLANAGQALHERAADGGDPAEPRRGDAPPKNGPVDIGSSGNRLNRLSTEPRISIVIAAAETSGWVRIEVADNGPGVAPEDVPSLFEPYFTRKAPGQGTGLGLAISRSIVDGFGGRLEYEPAETGGARFIIILPAIPEEEN